MTALENVATIYKDSVGASLYAFLRAFAAGDSYKDTKSGNEKRRNG